MTQEFDTTYLRPKNPDAVRNAGRRITFRVTEDLGRAIEHATGRAGYRFTSEFIRAAIISKIERMISES